MTCPNLLGRESTEDRYRAILDGQSHCDFRLTDLADPAGKRILVVGSGAGTDVLWCLSRGAKEVVGIDVLEQDQGALNRAIQEKGLDLDAFSFHQLAIEEATNLNQQFDLVLSNNVFEHIADIQQAFRACYSLAKPGGRVAIFTDPLFYSSKGSHLSIEPWEHLWEEGESIRARLVDAANAYHPLESQSFSAYLDEEISLNRMTLGCFLDAIQQSQFAILYLKILPDRHLNLLPRYWERLAAHGESARVPRADLAIEGIAVELLRLPEDTLPSSQAFSSVYDQNRANERRDWADRFRQMNDYEEELRALNEHLNQSLLEERGHRIYQHQAANQLQDLLTAVESSFSFRLGQGLTAPLRWLRDRLKPPE